MKGLHLSALSVRLILATPVLLLAGCGGGSEQTAATPSSTTLLAARPTNVNGLTVAQQSIAAPTPRPTAQVATVAASLAPVLDAAYEPVYSRDWMNLPGMGTLGYRLGQAFVPQSKGKLARVELALTQPCRSRIPGPTPEDPPIVFEPVRHDITVEIRRGSQVTGELLATHVIAGSSMPVTDCGPQNPNPPYGSIDPPNIIWPGIDLTESGPDLIEGQVYSIWPFYSPSGGSMPFWVKNSGGYANGAFYMPANGGGYDYYATLDAGFRTYLIKPPGR